jgi:hypothetical protein
MSVLNWEKTFNYFNIHAWALTETEIWVLCPFCDDEYRKDGGRFKDNENKKHVFYHDKKSPSHKISDFMVEREAICDSGRLPRGISHFRIYITDCTERIKN